MNKHFFIDGVRVASSARSWTAPIASVPALLTWRAPDLPGLPYGVVGFGCGAFGLLLLGLALRRRARGTDEGSLALRLGSVGTLLLVTPALLASPCGVGPPPVTSGLGTHDEPALFYLTDHLGSTILTIEDGGTARNRYYYLPFGDPGIANEGPSLRHRFTGQEILEGTGLYMLGVRVYDPETGRFLEPDPIVPDAANPQSFNRYSYAYNSPVNLIDPTGYTSEYPAGGAFYDYRSSDRVYNDSSRGPGNVNLHNFESPDQTPPASMSGDKLPKYIPPPPPPGVRPYSLDVMHVFSEGVAVPGQDLRITDTQRSLAAEGEARQFWESRRAVGDPVARSALRSMGVSVNWADYVLGFDYFFGGTQINNRIEAFAWKTGQRVALADVRSRLMAAHVRATDLDTEGIIGLLSPGQIARYHHVVFQQFGLPPTTFGGTAFTGSIGEADFYRLIWCQGCDQ